MISSFDVSYRVTNSTTEKSSNRTPKSRRIVVKASSKVAQARAKTKKSLLKINIDTINTRNSLKNERSLRISTTLNSSKNTSGKRLKLSSPSLNTRKNSTRLYSTGSNRSLKLAISPKSNQLAFEKIEYPMKPTKALIMLKHELTTYEHGEILKYSEIYFVGTIKNKLKPKVDQENHGFDDNHTDYLLVKNDHIAYRYEILNLLGKGSFGQVCECFDHKKKENVALKIIKNKPKFHQQAATEVKVLHALRENDQTDSRNIVRMKNYFSFRNHICITFELISINLYEFLRLNHFQGVSNSLIKCFARQIINGLDYTAQLGIVHCDLKPENVLLINPQKALVKIIDFGSSCFLSERLHTYIQSRFYRAPEIILGIPYTCAIDMWSLGCILVELYTGQPLWPGECEKDQLLHIISYMGMPPEELLVQSTRKNLFFEANLLKSNQLTDGKNITPSMFSLDSLIKPSDKDFLDFIVLCFEWNPLKRLSPLDASNHPWVAASKQSRSSFIDKKFFKGK